MHMKLFFAFTAAIMLGILSATPTAQAANHDTGLLEETIYRVQVGKIEDIKLLLERLGNPNATDKQGWPLLTIAASRTDAVAMPLVKLLVEMGADVNNHGGRMNYPLMAAVQSGNADIVKYLLSKGANYRATDASGTRIVDFARQSGDKEVIALIERAVNSDKQDLAHMHSQAYLDQITYDLAYNSCAMQYYSYYYKSEQDDIPQSTRDKTLKKYKEKVGTAMSHMMTFFRIPRDDALEIFNTTRTKIFSEMENMVSNRWRRQKGVGKDGDMEKRCESISAPYKGGIFNKEKLKQKDN